MDGGSPLIALFGRKKLGGRARIFARAEQEILNARAGNFARVPK